MTLWGNWFRLFTYALSTLCSLFGLVVVLFLRSKRGLLLLISVGIALSLLCTVYNILFGLRTPALLLCQGDISHSCMETIPCPVDFSAVKGPQAFLFSFSLCALLCFQSIALSSLLSHLRISSLSAQKHPAVHERVNSSSMLEEAKLIPPPSIPLPVGLSNEAEAVEVLSVDSGTNKGLIASTSAHNSRKRLPNK